jgi:hypothetical protein
LLHFQLFDLIRWMHLACFTLGGGGAVASVLISGLEDDREDLRGLAAALWRMLVCWSFRFAVLSGGVLLALKIQQGYHPLSQTYLMLKLVLVFLLLGVSEASPKALARGKRGAPLLAILLFLMATFVAINAGAFSHRLPLQDALPAVSAGPAS